MANKKKKVQEPFTPIFNDVLEGMAYTRLKPNEYQFIFVLWRLSFGNRNKQTQDGQWIEYSNAEFHYRTGLPRHVVSRIKADLLKKKVIKQKKGKIGFNRHFKLWSKQAILSMQAILPKQAIYPERIIEKYNLNRQRLLPKQATTITQTGNINAHRAKSSAEVQSLKKERKKETISKDKDFDMFWGKYPKKRQKVPAKKAWDKHRKKFTLDQILVTLEAYIKEDWVGRELQFIPHAASWLNKEPWEDFKPDAKEALKADMTKQLERIHFFYSGGKPGWDKERYEEERKQIINTYKEKLNEVE